MTSPYLDALELVKKHPGTSGQAALAKCILSLYNYNHAFSIGDILAPLDDRYTACVLSITQEYARIGENAELRKAGEWVYENFPGLIELSRAMSEARSEVRARWARESEARAEAEEEREEARRKEREAKAKSLHCTYCGQYTRHLPSFGHLFECRECGQERDV